MKFKALVLHRLDRSPGQRYRFEQYTGYLKKNGIIIEYSPLIRTKNEDLIFYSSGNYLRKIILGLNAFFRRLNDVSNHGQYDGILIFRDAFFFGTFFEKWLRKKKLKIIYDFDDAIWLMDKNENQGIFNKLKNPNKTSSITSIADLVIVGNDYLAKYASRYNSHVVVIPSTIDFSQYKLENKAVKSDKICIGWTGSFSTLKHFESLLPVLLFLKNKFRNKIYFKLIGDSSYQNNELEIQGIKWNANTETADLSELDIGIMPLPDNEWTQGKCGMKGLQYMALEIPTIMSPVGVNKDIIQDGENGLLASTEGEWVEKLSRLIEDEVLRKKLGIAGRKTVEENYSVDANKEKWLRAFKDP